MIEHYEKYLNDFDKYREKVIFQPKEVGERIEILIEICENITKCDYFCVTLERI